MNPAVLSSTSSIYIVFLASFLIWVLFAGLGYLWVIDGRIKKEIVLHALFAIIVAWAVSEITKTLFPTLRPFQVNGKPPLTFTFIGKSAAFPSAHTAIAFALSTSVFLHSKKIGFLFILGSIGVGFGRILGNVHYPLDVFGGAVIGTITAVVIDRIHVYNLLLVSRRKKSNKIPKRRLDN